MGGGQARCERFGQRSGSDFPREVFVLSCQRRSQSLISGLLCGRLTTAALPVVPVRYEQGLQGNRGKARPYPDDDSQSSELHHKGSRRGRPLPRLVSAGYQSRNFFLGLRAQCSYPSSFASCRAMSTHGVSAPGLDPRHFRRIQPHERQEFRQGQRLLEAF